MKRKAIVTQVTTCPRYPLGSPLIDIVKVFCNGREYYLATDKIGEYQVDQEIEFEPYDVRDDTSLHPGGP